MENQPTTRGGGVDGFLQGPEPDVPFCEGVQLVDEVPDRTAETIEPPDDEGVTRSELIEELVEFGAMLQRPGDGSTNTR